MSVRTWKKIITLVVVLTIISLIAGLVVSKIRYNNLAEEFDDALSNEFIVDLSQYGNLDETELEHLFDYLGNLDTNETLEYQSKYSDLYVENDFEWEDLSDEKICYLTFDDGPDSDNTARILDVLKEYNVSIKKCATRKKGFLWNFLKYSKLYFSVSWKASPNGCPCPARDICCSWTQSPRSP